ncbi:aminodeoxychorismate synthase component I [Pseudolactococcus insecticola]|uniref:Aminodeoxychorismate synthase, component I n=1 Tax=Pseudolactococcus insecticola TaxID=2709158 RepID=A0A6A0B8H3_9LACT|nr:aminodeoxychorismate synthase component I [Lactococcus insecticola]GFH40127.1 aminodeoxychorismate synthase, component I [Lactococcus insecticola]
MMIYDEMQFEQPVATLIAFDSTGVISALAEMATWQKTHYLLGYMRYEARHVFQGEEFVSKLPLLYFQVFESYRPYARNPHSNPLTIDLQPRAQLTFSDYSSAFDAIKAEQRGGNTYEVNYSYDYAVDYEEGDELALYEQLLMRQKTSYTAFIQNGYETMLSFSPELFFEISDRHITTRPMKGTVKRGKSLEEDAQLIDFLKTDEKNRAENVMIVDLMRNDLGRIAETGTVKVTKLFDVETHPTVHQMTSQIEADLKENTSLFDICQALFPNGSVTGAPKLSTMAIIDKLERGSRDIYCGAIGFLSPEQTIFSVPIRILQRKKGQKSFKYRVGGAIVWDSEVKDEWLETQNKTAFLENDLQIIETFKLENGKALMKNEHLARLKKSAEYYGFAYHPERVEAAITKPEKSSEIMRLALNHDGTFELTYRAAKSFSTVTISEHIVDSQADFLYHKTSKRPYFKAGQDELFFNEKGELTEMSRANIVLDLAGELVTPPVTSGLLQGLYREKLLASGKITERILYREDLLKADKIYCCNSIQGLQEVILLQ